MVRVRIDQDLCIGCGLCESLCPEVFRLTAEGKSEVVNPNGCNGCDCRSVADQCPVSAIIVEE